MKSNPWIYKKTSSIHCYGVFAKTAIPAETRIIEYTGQIIPKKIAEEKPNQDYLFELNGRFHVDGRNTARYINHSCDPNAESDVIKGKIWIIAARKIKAGEEITYNYGYSLEEGLQYPCRCGTSKCVGFILDYDEWGKLKKLNARKRKERLRQKAKKPG